MQRSSIPFVSVTLRFVRIPPDVQLVEDFDQATMHGLLKVLPIETSVSRINVDFCRLN